MTAKRPRAKPKSGKKRTPWNKGKEGGSKSPATDILETTGLDAICSMMEQGMAQAEIARQLGVSPGQISGWLAAPERSARAQKAREASAEAWMDRALVAIEQSKTTTDVARAREMAQHCRKMAAIRNPRYGDKLQHTGDGGGPVVMYQTPFTNPQ